MKKVKRFLTLLLVMAMIFTGVPMDAFAVEATSGEVETMAEETELISLKLGETFRASGIVDTSVQYDSNIVDVENIDNFNTHTLVDFRTLEVGESREVAVIFVNNGTYAMSTAAVDKSGTECRSLVSVNDASDLTEYAWTITKEDVGYIFRTAEGKYLSGDGHQLKLSDDAFYFNLEYREDGSCTVDYNSGSKQYFNNFQGSNTAVGGWGDGAIGVQMWLFESVITAKTFGETDVKIGDKTYHVTVKCEEKDVIMHVGDTARYNGALTGTVESDAVSAVQTDLVFYNEVNEIKADEKYVIVTGHSNKNAIVKAESGTHGNWGTNVGLYFQTGVSFEGTAFTDHEWTFTPTGAVDADGDLYYTVKSPAGQYINITGKGAVSLAEESENPPTVILKARSGGGFLIKSGVQGVNNVYLNNLGGMANNQLASAWDDMNSHWYLYERNDGYVTITADAEGKAEVMIDDVLYHITVLGAVQRYQEIFVKEGKTVSITDPTGNFAEKVSAYDKELLDVTVADGEGQTVITFTGKKEGRTTVQVGAAVYYVYVTKSTEAAAEAENVVLYVGQSLRLKSDINGILPEVFGNGFETFISNYEIAGKYEKDVLAIRGDEVQTIGGVDAQYVGTPEALKDCLYTFALNADGSTYVISAKDKNSSNAGGMAYISHTQSLNKRFTNTGSAANISIVSANGNGTAPFYLKNGSRTLHFWASGANIHKLDGGTNGTGAGYQFQLYRPMNAEDLEGADSNIPGYVKLTNTSEIESGKQYLIVYEHDHNGTACYYAIYPSTAQTSEYAQLVRATNQVSESYGHEIILTGAAVGKTTLQAGNKTYNITVVEKPETLTLESTPFVSETGKSNGSSVTRLTMTNDNTFNLDISDSYEGTVTWSIVNEDGTVADWATIDENGVITPNNTGTENRTGYVVAAIQNGESAAAYSLPFKLNPRPVNVNNQGYRLYDIYLTGIKDTTLYYGWIFETTTDNYACSSPLREAIEGEVIYNSMSKGMFNALDFFGKPNEGYALSYMGATGSENHYMKVSGVETPEETAFVATSGVAGAQQFGVAPEATKTLVQMAMDAGCDGAQGFTRYDADNGGVSTMMDYRSEKLPTVTKEVAGVLGSSGLQEDWTPATPGVTLRAEVGDYVYFKVTVQTYDAEDQITYTSVQLKELLEGATFYTKNTDGPVRPVNGSYTEIDITDEINADGLTGAIHEYYAVYLIEDDILDPTTPHTNLVNQVALDLSYSSQYSSAAYAGTGADQADILITTTMTENLVVDFGLPLEYTIASVKEVMAKKDTTTYGTGSVSVTSTWNAEESIYENKVVYTPLTILEGVDYIELIEVISRDENGDPITGESIFVGVNPATSVYYEEGFMDFIDKDAENGVKWDSKGSRGNGTQAARLLTTKVEVLNKYGYDFKYASEAPGPSNGTEAVSTTAGNMASFDFTGTGVDIYANCTADSGNTTIVVREQSEDGNGAIKKLMVVNTKMAVAENPTSATNGQAVDTYSIPIASVNNLEHGAYSVKIQHSTTQVEENGKKVAVSKPFKLDGFRVYNTLEDSSVFEVHHEANPNFAEMRNLVLNSMLTGAVPEGSAYAQSIAANLTQVLDQSETAGAVILTPSQNGAGGYTEELLKDLLDNGPKNELFLFEGQSLVFQLAAGVKNPQIGLKAASNIVAVQVNNGDDVAVANFTSSTDMFYGLGDVGEEERTVVITNAGGGILSVTDLKYFTLDAQPMEVFGRLREADLVPVLLNMGYASDPEAVTPEVTVEPTTEPTAEPTETEAPAPTETEAPQPTEIPDATKDVTEVFSDVHTDWYTDYVQYVYDNGLMTGIKGTDRFEPNANITKAQVAQVLYNMEGQPMVTNLRVIYDLSDIPEIEWYTRAVAWAYNRGIVTGDTNAKKFFPNADVTREQLALMMYRYAEWKEYDVSATSEFAGLENAENVSNWAADGMRWAVGEGLISGVEKDGVKDLDPQGNATRAQMAAILQRFCENKY